MLPRRCGEDVRIGENSVVLGLDLRLLAAFGQENHAPAPISAAAKTDITAIHTLFIRYSPNFPHITSYYTGFRQESNH